MPWRLPTHVGITEGTFCRDQAYYFYHLGKSVERADQTIGQAIDLGLHEFIDWVQRQLMLILAEIQESFCVSRQPR